MDNRGVRKRRSKGLKEPQTGALSGSPSARESRLQVAPESTSQPATQPSTPLMPTPMSPMKKFADAQFTAQHNNSVHCVFFANPKGGSTSTVHEQQQQWQSQQ
ncbi:hypothetical protein BGZ75_000172 [Mortierella antarctica]|nr:hypothetical protein BGZ75_000172 [Mortierella antarctica]